MTDKLKKIMQQYLAAEHGKEKKSDYLQITSLQAESQELKISTDNSRPVGHLYG
jgi:hypothetical protein